MNVEEIYHFLFETFEGIACLLGIAILISILACAIWERKTKKILKVREDARKEREELRRQKEKEEGLET